MLNRWKLCFLCGVLLAACIGSEHDTFSDDINYQPSFDLPISHKVLFYEDSTLFPISPLLSGSSVSFSDFLVFDFQMSNSGIERSEILSLMLHLEFINRFPIPMDFELYCPLPSGKKLVLSDDAWQIAAAQVDDLGMVTKERSLISDIILTEEQLNQIYDLNTLILSINCDNMVLSSSFFQMLSWYDFVAQFGIRAHLKVSL